VSGAWIGGELHLAPLVMLRERGVLERTLRHVLVHAMTDDALRARPAWVREGAALFFADPAPPASPPRRGPCPRDDELLQPATAGELADAYARARSCFARQVEAGRAWRDVR
jgi:hypothetical protein